jgi:hypothetical protein
MRGCVAIVTDAGRDPVDAGGASDEGACLRTAKSRGPDAPTLASSWRMAMSALTGLTRRDPLTTVANKPGHRGAREGTRHSPHPPRRKDSCDDSGATCGETRTRVSNYHGMALHVPLRSNACHALAVKNGLERNFESLNPYRQGRLTALVMPIRIPATMSGLPERA